MFSREILRSLKLPQNDLSAFNQLQTVLAFIEVYIQQSLALFEDQTSNLLLLPISAEHKEIIDRIEIVVRRCAISGF